MKAWMSFKEIRDSASLALFQAETARRIHVELPLDYLSHAKVVALISPSDHRILGGFVIAHEGPLRAFEQLPGGWVEGHEYLRKRRVACFEINGFWLNHREAPAFSCFALYARCFFEIALQAMRGKTHFVYAFDAKNKRLEEMFSSFHSVRVFHGEVAALPGMHGPATEIVEVCSLARLVLSALREPGFVFARLRPRRRGKVYA